MPEHVRTEKQDGILILTLNRPEKKNALTRDMYLAVAEALVGANADDDVRAILLTGAGGTFCAGNDIADFARFARLGDEAPSDVDIAGGPVFLRALLEVDKPMVAAVDGAAVGVGATMLLHFDFIYASTRAQLHFPFVDLALVPEAGATLLLPRLVGHQVAARLLMLGEPASAAQLESWGLVHRVVEADELMETALATAAALAAKNPEALRRTRRLLRSEPESVADRISVEFKEIADRLVSREAQAIFQAFLAKQPQ